MGTVIADGTVENVFGPTGLAEQVDDTSQTAQFASADALDSIRLITDGSGNVVGSGNYGAWGMPDSASVTLGGFGFTREQVDPESGLVYLRNRYYDPTTGRFLTPDPLGFLGSGVNLYSCTQNSPTNSTDATGECPLCVTAAIGAVAGAAIGVGVYTATHQSDFSWKGAAESAAGEAVVGAIVGSGAGLIYGAVAAGASGTAAVVGGTVATGGAEIAAGDLETASEAATAVEAGSEVCPYAAAAASESQVPEPEVGMNVYRVWGQDYANKFGRGSGPWGGSWTPVNLGSADNYRATAGLPDYNLGRFGSEGYVNDTTGTTTRPALELDGNPGGVVEYVIPNAESTVTLTRVSGVNPPY